jgi:catechol 2,3-dioxygenase-like lactoylglutathione lyase family enzyme
MTSPIAAMRTARPTTDLSRIRQFYEQVVGLPLLGEFADHDGFDGAIFGVPDDRAQLELVASPHGENPSATGEDALVLYTADDEVAAELATRLRQAGTPEITLATDRTLNPYWPNHGATCFTDPDGYRLILVPPTG